MQKRTITKCWIWGLAAMIPAGILIPSSAAALADHLDKVTNNADHAFAEDRYAQTMVALIALGAVTAIAGLVIGFLAWVNAVRNTRHLADQRWFQTLLWVGIAGILCAPLFGVGLFVIAAATLAYVVGGPDSLAEDPRPSLWSKTTITKWAGAGWAVVGAGLLFALLIANLTNPGRPLHGALWPSLALISLGISVAVIGALVVAAAWWAAVFNTHHLADKTWFHCLVWSGIVGTALMPIVGLGAIVVAITMIAYARSAPDSAPSARSTRPGAQPKVCTNPNRRVP